MTLSPTALAAQLLGIIDADKDRLDRIDNYLLGIQDMPYMPRNADDEYRSIAKRAVSNWCPLLVGTPAQAMYVDSFRPSRKVEPGTESQTPEWKHWQLSRLDARQATVHRGALAYGHSFTLTEKGRDGKVRTKSLSPLRTAALYEDPANDCDPYAALTVTRFPQDKTLGKARLWVGPNEYAVVFKSLTDKKSVQVAGKKKHGAPECPVTRFAAAVDIEGRTIGVIEPMIPLQNRINQTVFDLLVTQTYASFKVRWVTGMAPPMILQWFDANENPVPEPPDPENPPAGYTLKRVPRPMDHNAKRFLFAEDHEARFGTMDETPLGGFIESVDMSIRHLAAVSQTPPHHLLGQIANLSAEALLAAETALSRKVEEFRKAFGESWERVFRLAAAMGGDSAAAEDFGGEVIWRDMEQRSLAQSADALGKLSEALGIPKRGLWARVPNATQNELNRWEELLDEEDTTGRLADGLKRAGSVIDLNLDDAA